MKHPKFEEFVASFPEVALDENQKTIISERSLLLPNGERENWRQVARRVALAAALANKKYDTVEEDAIDFFEKIYTLQIVPATPVLLNSGTKHQQIFSCFAVTVPDDMDKQYDIEKLSAKIFKKAAGVGMNFSAVRAYEYPVGDDGTTAYGVLKLMYGYHVNCDRIRTGSVGRRGAQLAALDVYHPEIFKFVQCKTNENHYKTFNISVIIDQPFLDAVRDDKMITCRTWKGERPPRFSARRLFAKICDRGWFNGEPGVLFLDNANLNSPIAHFGAIESCNPCFGGDELLKTTKGYRMFKDLEAQDIEIIDSDGNVVPSKVWCSGVKPTIILNFSGKGTMTCTKDHRLMTAEHEEILAIDSSDKRLHVDHSRNKREYSLYTKLGFIQGDGCLGRLNSKTHKGFEINIGHNDNDIRKLFGYKDSDFTGGYKVYTEEFTDTCKSFGFDSRQLPERTLPATYSKWTMKQKADFLCGLYSANGSVINSRTTNSGRVSFKTTCKELVYQITSALAEFGITSTFTTNKPKEVEFSNGTYLCKESYQLNIGKFYDMMKFYKKIGFVHQYKEDNLLEVLHLMMPRVSSIKNGKTQKVYDFTSPITHWGVVNSFTVHNCGEIPTVNYGSCNLGSINLLTCLNEDNSINYDKFEAAIRTCTRLLDSLIDVCVFPDQQFEKVEKHIRSIGITIMGFADLLIKHKIRYGSEESMLLAEKLAEFRQRIAVDESEKLAAIKGVAPVFLPENGAPESAPKRRNAFLTTQAPCGSVSMIANCSPSMEPIFGLTMTKKCLDGKKFKYINADFDAFLKSKRIPEEHLSVIKDYVYNHGSLVGLPPFVKDDMLIEYWSPEEISHFVIAHEVSYQDRVKMQAAFQKHTDQAISSTVNLPETATREDIGDMIVMAHNLGLKGICFFRNNSRKHAVMNLGDPDKNSWVCLHCGNVNVETDPDLDPSKVCIKCPTCGSPSCANK